MNFLNKRIDEMKNEISIRDKSTSVFQNNVTREYM